MLGSAAPATASLHTSTNSATPSSPTRPSRLRGLSYLRTYTRDHLHGSGSGSGSGTNAGTGNAGSASQTPQDTTTSRAERRRSLTRSTSYPTNPRARDSTAASGVQSGENGWLPTVQGRSGLNREGANLTATTTDPAQPEPTQGATMTSSEGQRRGASNNRFGGVSVAPLSPSQPEQDVVPPVDTGTPSAAASSSATPNASKEKDQLPTIRFIPHVETRSSRPSLHFTAVSRTLKNASTIVRVGRYSERDTAHADENTLPVGFKSKVVSRRHCEFWCTNGQWHVKDVKSSSGTFLNHVRLSSPGVESRPYPVNDGDVVQLGIDFKGGEEVIFRCVKIRIECNRHWQKSLNNFNTSTHKRLLKTALGKGGASSKARNRDSDAASVNSSECSICLNPVAPCQALFVAPCSHVWHYKCVRNLIHGPSWPNFLCPNCRFVADLEADVEPATEDEEEELFEEHSHHPAGIEESAEINESAETGGSSDDAVDGLLGSGTGTSDDDRDLETTALGDETSSAVRRDDSAHRPANITDDELAGLFSNASLNTPTPAPALTTSTTLTVDPTPSATGTAPMPISRSGSRNRAQTATEDLTGAHPRSATPTSTTQFALSAGIHVGSVGGNGTEIGPMTPRNDIGPFVLDGNAGRGGDGGREGLVREVVVEEREEGTH